MLNKKIDSMPVAFLSAVLLLSSCAKAPDSIVAKSQNVNQVAGNSNSAIPDPSLTRPSTPTSANVTSVAASNQSSKPPARANTPPPQIGSGGGDLALFTQVRGLLGSDPELLNSVIVEIKDGNATLSGKVSSEAQKNKAGRLVTGVKGIQSVKNNLRVSS